MAGLFLDALELSTYMPKQPQNEEVADLRIRLGQTQHQVVELQGQYQDLEARLAVYESNHAPPIVGRETEQDMSISEMRTSRLKRERTASAESLDTTVKSEQIEEVAASAASHPSTACVQLLSNSNDEYFEYVRRKHSRTASSSSLSSLAESDFIGASTAAAERSNISGLAITESNGAVHDNDAQMTSDPPFPFRAIVERNDNGSLKLLRFGELSNDFADDIVRLAATWEHTCATKLSKEWPAILKSILRTKIQCAWNRIEIGGNSHWTVDKPGFYACKKCAKTSRYCFKQHDGKLYLLPLPAAVAESSDPTEAGYYRQRNAQASSRVVKDEWSRLWRYA
ncbi:hypothetical protein LTR56_010333 [Elasticomyces elasticus]|nr:hypothetical protein LTR56_010333 [Elasticomyces elasticus]KAK3656901.1 hypothetical protein LTR22_009563 [Elasticomyces elasticus]KAK4926096.1 hypothetical protein LTR49_007011 [Elasticomyces elasticus]KAK5766133.1 hypothetical protein LTS12_003616 [Elasticomyces elasticus]